MSSTENVNKGLYVYYHSTLLMQSDMSSILISDLSQPEDLTAH